MYFKLHTLSRLCKLGKMLLAKLSETVLSLTAPMFNRKSRLYSTSYSQQSGITIGLLCGHTRKQQFSDKTVLMIASHIRQFFRHAHSLKGRASYTMSLSAGCVYQLSVHRRWRRSAHSTPVRLVRW